LNFHEYFENENHKKNSVKVKQIRDDFEFYLDEKKYLVLFFYVITYY